MSRTLSASAAALVAASLALLAVPLASAQNSWATLDAPPSGTAPPGDVLRAGHLGREIAELSGWPGISALLPDG